MSERFNAERDHVGDDDEDACELNVAAATPSGTATLFALRENPPVDET